MKRIVFSSQFLVTLLILVLAVQAVGITENWFLSFTWLDNILHFAGGLWVGIFFFYFFPKETLAKTIRSGSSRYLIALLALSFVALIGVGWEFFEFSLDRIFTILGAAALNQPSLQDTMSDLLLDLLGGGFSVLLYTLFL
jgi:hypothetical protein